MSVPIIYSDDADASWTFTVTSSNDVSIDWTSPLVAIGDGAYEVAATWETDPGTTRTLRVPLDGLATGTHRLYLQVPSGTDIPLGSISVRTRE